MKQNTVNKKPVYSAPTKTIINMSSGFGHKLLCDGLTFTAGSACAFSCTFCYVKPILRFDPGVVKILKDSGRPHHEVVIRREGAAEKVRKFLSTRNGTPRFQNPADTRVIYASPFVDVAANMELVRETTEICRIILDMTHWTIRLLSKSPLLVNVARNLPEDLAKKRMIFGFSTGTLDDHLAKSFEQGTGLVSRRIQALHELQDAGFRTFGMICPSLPQRSYTDFAENMAQSIRVEKCEHVWAEVLNARGEALSRTTEALSRAGYGFEAQELERVSNDKAAWEEYSRRTFLAHTQFVPPKKLRYLQYVDRKHVDWWTKRERKGAVLLGKAVNGSGE